MNEKQEIKKLNKIIVKKIRKIDDLQSKTDIDWRRQFYLVSILSGIGFIVILAIQILY